MKMKFSKGVVVPTVQENSETTTLYKSNLGVGLGLAFLSRGMH